MRDKIYISIVDDHTMFSRGLSVLINMFPGYSVVSNFANGLEFKEKIDSNKLPDIVLMDINMPQMDGYATTEWLRDNFPDIKVLALSTMDSENAIIKMIKSGAKGYILKDADPEELKIAFGEVMTSGFFFNEKISKKVLKAVTQLTDVDNKAGIFIKLTDREIKFLKFTCTELTYKEIAEKMFVSTRTVEGYRDNLCEKLELKTRVGLAMFAIKNEIETL